MSPFMLGFVEKTHLLPIPSLIEDPEEREKARTRIKLRADKKAAVKKMGIHVPLLLVVCIYRSILFICSLGAHSKQVLTYPYTLHLQLEKWRDGTVNKYAHWTANELSIGETFC